MKAISVIALLSLLAANGFAQTVKVWPSVLPPVTIKDWKLHKYNKASSLKLNQLTPSQASKIAILKKPLALNKYKKSESTAKLKKKTVANMPVVKPDPSIKYHVRVVKPDSTIRYHARMRKSDIVNSPIYGKTDSTTIKLP